MTSISGASRNDRKGSTLTTTGRILARGRARRALAIEGKAAVAGIGNLFWRVFPRANPLSSNVASAPTCVTAQTPGRNMSGSATLVAKSKDAERKCKDSRSIPVEKKDIATDRSNNADQNKSREDLLSLALKCIHGSDD